MEARGWEFFSATERDDGTVSVTWGRPGTSHATLANAALFHSARIIEHSREAHAPSGPGVGERRFRPAAASASPPVTKPAGFSPVDVSNEEYDRLYDQCRRSTETAQEFAEIRVGDDRHWPCPRCKSDESREAVFVRSAQLEADEDRVTEKTQNRPEGLGADVKRVRGWLDKLLDPTGSAVAAGIGGVFDRMSPAARVYACPRHGEFYVVLWLNEVKPEKILFQVKGHLSETRLRYRICPGLIQTADASGTIATELCEQILEWDREPDSCMGTCSYTCPLHGSQTFREDGSYEDFAHLMVRRTPSRSRRSPVG
jgi:hypothetical protein